MTIHGRNPRCEIDGPLGVIGSPVARVRRSASICSQGPMHPPEYRDGAEGGIVGKWTPAPPGGGVLRVSYPRELIGVRSASVKKGLHYHC